MCAQFRNRSIDESRTSPMRSEQPMSDNPGGALVVACRSLPAAMLADLDTAKRKYQIALDALKEQRVVIETLEELMARNVPPHRLKRDAAAQTDRLSTSAFHLPVDDLLRAKLELSKWTCRRRNAQNVYSRQLDNLKRELEELRVTALELLPKGVAMVGLTREGKLTTSVLPSS